jgi:hypothetical protein
MMAEAAVPAEGGAVLYCVADGTATITLNRPEVLNAINGAMHRGILDGLEQAGGGDTVRVVVIRGSGRAFSAGGDLKALDAEVARIAGRIAGLKAEAVTATSVSSTSGTSEPASWWVGSSERGAGAVERCAEAQDALPSLWHHPYRDLPA